MDGELNNFYANVAEILQNAKGQAKTAVNLAMVYAYYNIGRMIVEEEQKGEIRVEYGKYVLQNLAEYLTGKFGKEYSKDNLELMRKFYLVYSKDAIGETLFPQLGNGMVKGVERKFCLSWSHYLKLMRITNVA